MSDTLLRSAFERKSPFLTIWLNPRQTIEGILADRPDRLVLLLAALGGAALGVNWLVDLGVERDLIDWRPLLACVVGGPGIAILNLYVLAFVASWIGSMIGGEAPAAELRAVIAWGMLPIVAGAVLTLSALLAFLVYSGDSGALPKSLKDTLEIGNSICGLWSIAMTLLMLARVERFGFWRTIVTYGASSLFLPAVVALLIRTFLFQPFSMPSHSNSPTLLVGDYIFATKYAYGYSRYSLPFSPPIFSGRVFGSEPERGDVVVFRLPKDDETNYVKRVVGLPGERIQMKNGELFIDDTPVRRERLTDFIGDDVCGDRRSSVKRWRETLPNGVSYETLDCLDNGFYDNTPQYTVPEGHFFLVGDNRDNSTDSRVLSTVGYVPLGNIVGRMGMIFFSRAGGANGEPRAIRFERIGTIIR